MTVLRLESLPPRTTKGELLALVCAEGGLRREQVGRIDVQGNAAAIEIPAGTEARVARKIDGIAFKERRLRAWFAGASAANADDHFGRMARLLNLESEAEAQRILEEAGQSSAERSGESLTDLAIAEESSGLGGRCILTLTRRNRTLALPWNRLEPGSPVLLSAMKGQGGESWRGVVCERDRMELKVAFDEPPNEEDRSAGHRLHLSPDEKARQRQLETLSRAQAATRDRLAELRSVLLGETAPAFEPELPLEPLDPSLNASQQEAVRFALAAKDLAIVHGPPGTGKTTAVVEFIRQAVRRGRRVLACAPSNLAVDNLLERLVRHGERAVRLGHPARVLAELRERTLDLMVEDHDDTRLARKTAKKAFALFRQAGKWTRGKPEPGLRQQLRQEGRQLLRDARALEAQAIDRILDQAAVVCATLTGLDSEILGQRTFDVAVIDEAAQCTEPVCWLPLLRSRSLVLAGDHCQLPPTILSRAAADAGFGVSLMERLVASYGPLATRRLETQYRMHEAIMTFSALRFYEGALEAHASVREHLLRDLPGASDLEATRTPILFVDTAGAGYDEQPEPQGKSRCNPQEADLVARWVRGLLSAGIAAEAVGVVAPYSAQVRLLRERLAIPGLEIDSVDGFQGREKEAIVASLVRSNVEGDVGFLADVRRMNVAMTRARRSLTMIGDSSTLANDPFYKDFVAHCEAIGAYRSVWDLAPE